MNIIAKLKQSNLTGRGGACFPTWLKWSMVKKTKSAKKYVICNASEGEPGVKKDEFILNNYPEKVIGGIKIAAEYLGTENCYIYINHLLYKKYEKKLRQIIDSYPIELFMKPRESGYVGGEETALLNAMEGKRIGPRLRPPFPVSKGYWNRPTLINNVETFYCINLINSGKYQNKRFFSTSGSCQNKGVFEFPEDSTIEEILKETKNYPPFPFFVQIGGEASGVILNDKQLNQKIKGTGSITVYNIQKHNPLKLIKNWVNFYVNESCGKCTPCREGTFRLKEIINSRKPDWSLFFELVDNLSQISFCGLGYSLPIPIKSYMENVLLNLPEKNKWETICKCFEECGAE